MSPSSVEKDTQRLRHVYEAAGIGEYWIVDAREDDVDLTILTRSADEGRFAAALPEDGWLASALLATSIRIDREPDACGLDFYEVRTR